MITLNASLEEQIDFKHETDKCEESTKPEQQTQKEKKY